ncbi:MAG: ethanolamine ammonia-lyase light chain EutC [Gemmataceae bacterium]
MIDHELAATDRLNQCLARTPARVLVGRAGAGYFTPTTLLLREDHAAARDAVQAEINLERDFEERWIQQFQLFSTQNQKRNFEK